MKAFISYSHDSDAHKDRVLELSDRLRADGIDCRIDQYEQSPPEGWPRWMIGRVRDSDLVLVVCTETYNLRFEGREAPGRGKGAKWEGGVITQELYDAEGKNSKFIPIIFDPLDSPHIPLILKGATYYDLSAKTGYDLLYRHLTSQPLVRMPALGKVKPMPPLERKQEFTAGGFHIPHERNPFFTGREKLLEDLEKALKDGGRAALSGLGGIGKTQTVIEYAYRHRDEYPQGVLWAKASTREELISDFAAIARVLDLQGRDAEDQNIAVNAAKRWFEEHSGWLLILDNADDLKMAKEFIPTGKGDVLLTTRASATGSIAKCVDVLEMPTEEGALFLLRRAKIIPEDAPLDDATENDRSTAIGISEEMDGLPLALDQAGAFIEESCCGLPDYLAMYRTEGEKLRAERGNLATDYPDSVATTWTLSFRKVEEANKAAADILRLSAFLAPDAIPEEIFAEGADELGENLAPVAKSPVEFNKALGELQRYSLIGRKSAKRILDIHRLVQAVLQDDMAKAVRRSWLERVICALDHVFPRTEFSDWQLCDRLMPHTQAVAALIRKRGIQVPQAGRLLHHAGSYLHERALYTQAEPLLRWALEITEQAYGKEHLNVATVLNNLALLYTDQGMHKKAELLLKRALKVQQAVCDANDAKILSTLSNLASLYHVQRRYGEAESLFLRTLDTMRQALGPSHADLATHLNNLGMLYYEQHRYGEAEPYLKQALKIRQEVQGTAHPDTANSLCCLAVLHNSVGKYVEAELLFADALRIISVSVGTDHPIMATVLRNYAVLLRNTNREAQAQAMEIRALAIRQKHERENPSGK